MQDEHREFDCQRFEQEVFGVGRFPNSWDNRPGWNSWSDVREYFGIGFLKANEWKLRQGLMGEDLYGKLAGKIGEERLKSFFPKPVEKPKLSKEEQSIEDIATLMFGSAADVAKMRNRK